MDQRACHSRHPRPHKSHDQCHRPRVAAPHCRHCRRRTTPLGHQGRAGLGAWPARRRPQQKGYLQLRRKRKPGKWRAIVPSATTIPCTLLCVDSLASAPSICHLSHPSPPFRGDGVGGGDGGGVGVGASPLAALATLACQLETGTDPEPGVTGCGFQSHGLSGELWVPIPRLDATATVGNLEPKWLWRGFRSHGLSL